MADDKEKDKKKEKPGAAASFLANMFGGLLGNAAQALQSGATRNAAQDEDKKKKNK